MFDALQDTPKDFQTKLIGALNSLSQTMKVPAEDVFNQVLCASNDENQDVKKKLYNWWRAFFEVLGKVSDGKIPKDRESEYNDKIDDLMAEIMKSGDAESTEDEVVMEAEEDLGYQQADKADEDEMMKDFDFAIQHIGEIANRVKDIVNFVNPYCEKTFNEVDNTMKKTNERGGSDWVSMDDLVGKEFGESDDADYEDVEPQFKVGDKVCWTDPETDKTTCGWTVIAAPEEGDESGDEIYTIEHPRGSEVEVYVDELEPDMMMNEASVVVDANDVWEVLDLLDDEVANKNLTDLINSHVRTEEEIMDAIDSYVERYWSGKITKQGLVEIFTKYMYEIVDELGLDVEKFKQDGQFVEPEKPVALEGSDEEQKPDEVKDGEKKYKQDGETKTLDFGENKKPVCEMTIEQEIDDPWNLLELLWGQGRENFRDLLESELIDDDTLMMCLEDMEIKNLTSINDAFAFDFPTILDMLGLDGKAWSQNLEIKRKEDDGSED